MGMYAVESADSGELAEFQHAAREGRARARERRRRLSQGKQALTGDGDQAPGSPEASGAGSAAGAGSSNGARGDAVASARSGRARARERRRRLSQGKQALKNGGGGQASGSPEASGGAVSAPSGAGSAGGAGSSDGARDAVASAQSGRARARERRRRLSQGKQALKNGGGGQASGSPEASGGAVSAPSGAGSAGGAGSSNGARDAVASARSGRARARERRRRLSQGKQALKNGDGDQAPAAPGGNGAQPAPAEASRDGGARIGRAQGSGRIEYPPKVTESPTHGGQQVTGVKIDPGARVTGEEAGAALPVSGTQYVSAKGAAPAAAAGTKVSLVRTRGGLVVSGTTVRNKVSITGDEAGEHLPITGEAEAKLDDDVTPRSDGSPDDSYVSSQFPRRADPHGATAVGTRLGDRSERAVSRGTQGGGPVEATDGGLKVTGTALGRSVRVTGDEAGACRTPTGDQYQSLPSSSSECGGTGGGTAPAEHLGRDRRDPVTLGKVTQAQTWAGQVVTGPSLEHRPNVTGDEPGSGRPLTGTPYQGPSTVSDPDEAGEAARLASGPAGTPAVTGDVPMHDDEVTGTSERGRAKDVSGTPYYDDLRAPEAAAEDWASGRAFPVALARRHAGEDSDDTSDDTAERDAATAPASTVPGGITGSFAISREEVTGTDEFQVRPRTQRDAHRPVVTGEGRVDGPAITGSAWTIDDRVTGTEGYIAAGRNPSQGGGSSHAWAGARRFKGEATPPGPRQEVTGRSGWTEMPYAVTYSGGAQG